LLAVQAEVLTERAVVVLEVIEQPMEHQEETHRLNLKLLLPQQVIQ
jgi:hypothetical protein